MIKSYRALSNELFPSWETDIKLCVTSHPPSFRAVVVCCMRLQPRIATALMSREISLAYGNTGLFTPVLELKARHSHYSRRSLDSFLHTIFNSILTPAHTTARDDVICVVAISWETAIKLCVTSHASSFRAVCTCYMTIQLRIATASRRRKIFLASGNTGLFASVLELKARQSHDSRRSLDSFSHTIFHSIHTPAHTTARDDGLGIEIFRRKCYFRYLLYSHLVISSGVSMRYDSAV